MDTLKDAERYAEQQLARKRNRQIEELENAAERPTVLPSTKRWIQKQIKLLKSGGAAA